MTDQLDDLFRELRAETLTVVRPPGAVAARRTLRRRRRTRTVGAAACLAVAGVGGVGAHLLGPPGGADVGHLPERAAAAVKTVGPARFSGQGAAESAVVAGGVAVAGHYALALSCAGRGRVTLSIKSGGAEMGSVAARCSDDGAVSTGAFTLPDTRTVTAELSTADGAAGRAGYAYTMTLLDADRDRLTRDATGTLPRDPLGPPVTEWVGAAVGVRSHDAMVAAGGYRVFYTCAGAGRIVLTVRTPDSIGIWDMDCQPPLRADAQLITMTDPGTLSVRLVPDAGADRRSAYAVRLERF